MPHNPLRLARARRFAALVVLAAAAALAGCASVPNPNPRDPLESYNRAVFAFNDRLDDYLLRPLAEGYRFVVPQLVRTGVANFFGNLNDVWIGANNLLQGKVGNALSDWMRVGINSTFGLGGVLDVASEAQLPKSNEDFGQTLGWWGVGSGTYLVLPVFGPSTVRDGAALPVDLFANSSVRGAVSNAIADDRNTTRLENSLFGLNVVDTRAQLLQATNLLSEAALDRYSFVRNAYLQRRQNLVYDGRPPRPKDDDDDDARVPTLERVHAYAERARGLPVGDPGGVSAFDRSHVDTAAQEQASRQP